MKSSAQRAIRTKLLAQIPLLSSPSIPAPPRAKDSDDSSAEEEEVVRKKGAKKEKGKGGKGGRKEVVEEVEEVLEEEVLTLLDVLWPKKEGLTLVKW